LLPVSAVLIYTLAGMSTLGQGLLKEDLNKNILKINMLN
jgi:hypothetical protein